MTEKDMVICPICKTKPRLIWCDEFCYEGKLRWIECDCELDVMLNEEEEFPEE